jgi:hypothetical protein
MTDSRLVDYIRKQSKAGYDAKDIIHALLTQGWSQDEINEAFALSSADQKPKEELPAEQAKAKQEKPPQEGTEQKKAPEGMEQKKESPSARSYISARFILTVAGGVIIILNAMLVFLEFGDLMELLVASNLNLSILHILDVTITPLDQMLINTIIGIFLITTSYIVFSKSPRMKLTGVFIVALSAVSALIGNGFLLGGAIGILGGISAIYGR